MACVCWGGVVTGSDGAARSLSCVESHAKQRAERRIPDADGGQT